MALFLKKGVHDKSGQNIYPKPTQTNTGNCLAYSLASCLYAFGLDHDSRLIPSVNGGTAAEQFQVQMARMVEELTDLFYTQKKSQAEACRKYIEDRGLKDKFIVTEATGNTYTLPDGTQRPTWDWIIEELRRCQDIIIDFKWIRGCCTKDDKHAVTLVGIDDATGEAIVANPWGNPGGTTNVPPDEAGGNTEAGKTERAFTRVKFHKAADGKVTVDVTDPGTTVATAEIYKYLIVCPVETRVAMRVDTEVRDHALASGLTGREYGYTVRNNSFSPVNAFAVELPGIGIGDLLSIRAPSGWTGGPWYRERETHFDLLAPEILGNSDPGTLTFAGIVWRSETGVICAEQALSGFAIEVVSPDVGLGEVARDAAESKPDGIRVPLLRRLAPLLDRVPTWTNTNGHAIGISEHPDGTLSSHVDAVVPKRVSHFADRLRQLIETL
jgi:hypothetical protein